MLQGSGKSANVKAGNSQSVTNGQLKRSSPRVPSGYSSQCKERLSKPWVTFNRLRPTVTVIHMYLSRNYLPQTVFFRNPGSVSWTRLSTSAAYLDRLSRIRRA